MALYFHPVFQKCSKYYQFHPQSIFQVYSFLPTAGPLVQVSIISELYYQKTSLTLYFCFHSCQLPPHPPQFSLPKAARVILWKEKWKHVRPFSETISIAFCCSKSNQLFTLAYKISWGIYWPWPPPLWPQLLPPHIPHSATPLNQHKLIPASHPLHLLLPLLGIPSPQVFALSLYIKPLPKCLLKEFPVCVPFLHSARIIAQSTPKHCLLPGLLVIWLLQKSISSPRIGVLSWGSQLVPYALSNANIQ